LVSSAEEFITKEVFYINANKMEKVDDHDVDVLQGVVNHQVTHKDELLS